MDLAICFSFGTRAFWWALPRDSAPHDDLPRQAGVEGDGDDRQPSREDEGPALDPGEDEWEKTMGETLNAKLKASRKEAEQPAHVQNISMMEPISSMRDAGRP